jgi:mannose-6-phosphate isomerase-like protein (cupin superfamily)
MIDGNEVAMRTRTGLAAFGVLALLAGCGRRHDQEVTHSGMDTIIRSSTVKDTTIVHADTGIEVDTIHKTNHIKTSDSAGPAEDSAEPGTLRWGPQPPGLPAGARAAVVRGDPSKAGPFTVRLDFPDGYQVPPHWHPTSERLRVLAGTLLMGDGREWSDKGLRPLGTGQEATVAAQHAHYVRAKGKTMVEIRSTGPFEITYVNTADDPRKAPIQ